MMTFTYITAVAIGLGIICLCMPRKLYLKGQVDFRILGTWLAMVASSIQLVVWLIHWVINWIQGLLLIYGLSWGFAV